MRGLILYLVLFALVFSGLPAGAQDNLLVNGGFEDINTCEEYKAECGVEGWFYLRDVKSQMFTNDDSLVSLGSNSFGIYLTWTGYRDFIPLIGTMLPCGLQTGKQYRFRGLVLAKLNPRLHFQPGMTIAPKFYVPSRPFSRGIKPAIIAELTRIPNSNFYQFETRFTATGEERFLTFGAVITEDSTGGKKVLTGNQTVSVVLENFELIPEDGEETICPDFEMNRRVIYGYDHRHKDMDYSLYGKGELPIRIAQKDSGFITQKRVIPPIPEIYADTLALGQFFFDFNKARLKAEATERLSKYFDQINTASIDSIHVEGHTDSIGTDASNLALSMNRCESVKSWLLNSAVVDAGRIKLFGFGKSRPVSSNSTDKGRSLNRRVEIIIFQKKST